MFFFIINVKLNKIYFNMVETLELLKKINWFLKPVSDVVLFFFTSGTGITLLLIGMLIYLIATIANAVHVRQLLSAKSNYSGRASGIELIYIAVSELWKFMVGVVTRIPVILGVIICLWLVVGLSSAMSTVEEFASNEQRIKELSAVVRNLNQRYKVAEVKVLDQTYSNQVFSTTTKLSVTYFDYAGLGLQNNVQEVTIRGNDIYFDAVVLNFDYSEVETGANKNIVLPYRIFSNEVPQSQGVQLKLLDKDSIPFVFKRTAKDVYGISIERYNSVLRDILLYMKNEDLARKAGIRTVYGNAVHQLMYKGGKYSVWVEQTGGIVIKQEVLF